MFDCKGAKNRVRISAKPRTWVVRAMRAGGERRKLRVERWRRRGRAVVKGVGERMMREPSSAGAER